MCPPSAAPARPRCRAGGPAGPRLEAAPGAGGARSRAGGAVGGLPLPLGIRAWVVETGHATLGRTPVKVKVLTGACAVAALLVAGTVTADGGTRLVYLLLHPAQAQAIEDAEKAANEAA